VLTKMPPMNKSNLTFVNTCAPTVAGWLIFVASLPGCSNDEGVANDIVNRAGASSRLAGGGAHQTSRGNAGSGGMNSSYGGTNRTYDGFAGGGTNRTYGGYAGSSVAMNRGGFAGGSMSSAPGGSFGGASGQDAGAGSSGLATAGEGGRPDPTSSSPTAGGGSGQGAVAGGAPGSGGQAGMSGSNNGASGSPPAGDGGRAGSGSNGELAGSNGSIGGYGGVAGAAGAAAGAAGTASLGTSRWHWENPTPSGWAVYSLWGTSASSVYAVGAYGNLLHWDGLTWREARVGDQGDYFDIWGSSGSDVFVVGKSTQQILHFDGQVWAPMTNPAALPLNAIWGNSAADVYAVGGRYWSGTRTGVVVHYDGDEWSVLRNDFTSILTAVWGSGATDVFVGGENGTLLQYDGANYTVITGATGTITNIIGQGASDAVLVFDDAGNWYRYERNGTNLALGGHLSGVSSVWGNSLSNLYAACGTNGIYRYDGHDWTAETLPAANGTYDWRAVWGDEQDTTLFVGGYGAGGWDSAGVMRRTQGQWVNDSRLLTPNEFRDVWSVSSTLAYAVGDGGTLARWDGSAWSLIDLATTSSLEGVWAASANDVFVSSRSGSIYHWNGLNWTPTAIPGASELRYLRGLTATDLYVAGGTYNSPQFYHYDGHDWTNVTLPATLANVNEFWIDPQTSTVVIVGNTNSNDTGVFRRAPTETDWTQLKTPLFTAAQSVHGTSLSDLYVATSDDIYRYNGSTWVHSCSNPTDGYFTSLWARASDDVWAVGYDSLIQHFDGDTWSIVQNRNSGWELYAVHGSSRTDVIVVGESGTILRFGPQ
jgi:hypothetical protein